MILLSLNDFKSGKYKISQSGSIGETDVQISIETFEKKYIRRLFGATLGDLIIAYIVAGAGGNLDYDKVIGEFSADDITCFNGRNQIESLGLKELLKACIFYEFRKNGLKETLAGTVKTKSETGDVVNPAAADRNAQRLFNDCLNSADAIQWYCLKKPIAFPDFNGVRFIVKSSYNGL